MSLHFYNTLTRRKEAFKPFRRGEAAVYSCGPTVYNYAHIGNFRAYIFEDILCRALRARGYRVRQIMNITDVDDKTIQGARQGGKALTDFTAGFKEAFFKDLKTLSIEPAEDYPAATQYVPDMIRLIERLLEKGLAYETNGSVYYHVSKFPGYGKLSRMKLNEMRPGERVDRDEYAVKEEVHDFCLWKKAREDEPSWPSPFGPGRPGWHIECSAMSMRFLGETFDIHTGGEDNIFPHHENEIAQSEGATGLPFVRTWLHCKFLVVNGQKMAKSKGNWHTLRDLVSQGHSPEAIRYLLLSAHYRSTLNLTVPGLEQAHKTVEHLRQFLKRLNEYKPPASLSPGPSDLCSTFIQRFDAALDDDLNCPEALAALFDFIRQINTAIDENGLSKSDRAKALQALAHTDCILGVLGHPETEKLDKNVQALIAQREEARKRGDFKNADSLRDEIRKHGIILEDTPGGIRWHRQS